MQGPDISPLQRLVLAFYAFFAILFRADVAAAVFRIREARRAGMLPPPREPEATAAPAEAPRPPEPLKPAEPPKPAAPPKPAEPAAGKVTASAPEAARKVDAARPAAPEKATPPAPAKLAPAPEPAKAAPAAEPAKPAPAPAPEPAKPVEVAKPVVVKPPEPAKPDPRPALQLLAILQREGRLVDFIEEDLAGFPDAAIGAAARTVHAGCRRAIEEYFKLEPVYRQPEGAQVTVERGFDPSAVRLTGNVVGEPPFRGALRHHGWRAREVKIPPAKDGMDVTLVAPAEVELG